MNQLKIVFMGTATFSEAVLKSLIQHDYNIVQVVSQPDRRVGRKKELKMPEHFCQMSASLFHFSSLPPPCPLAAI